MKNGEWLESIIVKHSSFLQCGMESDNYTVSFMPKMEWWDQEHEDEDEDAGLHDNRLIRVKDLKYVLNSNPNERSTVVDIREEDDIPTVMEKTLAAYREMLFKAIDEMPIAYDLDGKIAELQNLSNIAREFKSEPYEMAMTKAIEILKEGWY